MSTRVPSLATLAHCLRIGIETLLHGIEQVLVLPSANALFPLTPEAELLANAPLSLRGPRSPALLRVYEKPRRQSSHHSALRGGNAAARLVLSCVWPSRGRLAEYRPNRRFAVRPLTLRPRLPFHRREQLELPWSWRSALAKFQSARQCGARTRSGKPCRSPATKKGRCRLHGGASGNGGPSGERNGQYRHGERTKTAIADRQKFSALLKMLRAGLT
jgi:hypothetical protein